MKRVVIVRHAKSVPYGYEDDFNRNLTERGFNIYVEKEYKEIVLLKDKLL